MVHAHVMPCARAPPAQTEPEGLSAFTVTPWPPFPWISHQKTNLAYREVTGTDTSWEHFPGNVALRYRLQTTPVSPPLRHSERRAVGMVAELGPDPSVLTWQSLCPLDDVDQLPLPEFIQAAQQVGEGIWLAVVVAGTHHSGLDGFQHIEENGLALKAIDMCHHHLRSLLLRGAG